jgi:predicted dehydrogenase
LPATLDIAVIGAGVIGREHATRIARNPRSCVAGVVDPTTGAAVWAEQHGFPHFPSVRQMLADRSLSGAIVATPTPLHVSVALELLDAGIPLLVEKPMAADLPEAATLVRAAEHFGQPVLAGYHRRHSPIVQAAQRYIHAGNLGRIVAVSGAALFHKPQGYFDVPWRTTPGGGPILINLAHEIDTLRYLAGEIVATQAVSSHRMRSLPVEDSAAAMLEFECGALATLVVSDCTVSPWSWEQTAGENPLYAREPSENSLLVAGERGSLALPSLRWWRQDGERSWSAPFQTGQIEIQPADPLNRQLDHFLDVIERRVAPINPPPDAFRSLAATLAIHEAITTGSRVTPRSIDDYRP